MLIQQSDFKCSKGTLRHVSETTFSTLGLFLLSMTTSGWMLLVSGGLIGLSYGTFMSNGQAVCLKKAQVLCRIRIALSTYFIGLDLGLGV